MPTDSVMTTITISAVTAILGYISTSLLNLRARAPRTLGPRRPAPPASPKGTNSSSPCVPQAQQHSGRVERVGEQLKELYGPLLACVTASKSAYDAMVRQVGGPGASAGSFRAAVRTDESSPEGVAYRAWVEEVLMPLSDRAAQLVVERADLLEGSSIEPLRVWNEEDSSDDQSACEAPRMTSEAARTATNGVCSRSDGATHSELESQSRTISPTFTLRWRSTLPSRASRAERPPPAVAE